jgi:GTPase
MKLSLTEYQNELISKITLAEENGWISTEDAKKIQSQINKDQLTIGVVGQMNVGKSTLVNALVFGKNALPTSETPMTAALTYITYGEVPCATVEMLSITDFEEIKEIAQRQLTEDEESEIKSAQKIVNKIESISSFEDLLGKTINISLEDFDEYVGADGNILL